MPVNNPHFNSQSTSADDIYVVRRNVGVVSTRRANSVSAFFEGDRQSSAFVMYGSNAAGDANASDAWIFAGKRTRSMQSFPVWATVAYRFVNLTRFISDVDSQWTGITEVSATPALPTLVPKTCVPDDPSAKIGSRNSVGFTADAISPPLSCVHPGAFLQLHTTLDDSCKTSHRALGL